MKIPHTKVTKSHKDNSDIRIRRSAFGGRRSLLCFAFLLALGARSLYSAPTPVFEIKVNANGDVISSTLPSNHTVNFPTGTTLKVNGVTLGGASLPTQTGHSGE